MFKPSLRPRRQYNKWWKLLWVRRRYTSEEKIQKRKEGKMSNLFQIFCLTRFHGRTFQEISWKRWIQVSYLSSNLHIYKLSQKPYEICSWRHSFTTNFDYILLYYTRLIRLIVSKTPQKKFWGPKSQFLFPTNLYKQLFA